MVQWSKVFSDFLGLLIALAIAFAIFWVTQPKEPKVKAKNIKLSENDTNTCPNLDLVGDGYCDDELNIPQCWYDLNDCCKMESDRTMCQNCTCLLSDIKQDKIHEDIGTVNNFGAKKGV